MYKKNLAFGRMNFILLAIGVIVVIIGLILMSGGGSSDAAYDPSIFDVRHIKVAPVVTFIGFISIIFAIMYKPSDKDDPSDKPAK